MAIKLITECPGKPSCPYFKSPESLLEGLVEKPDFANLMAAIEMIKMWKRSSHCPFRVKNSGNSDREFFHNAICSLGARPPYSMDAVSRGTGYSKTRVAQIEYTAVRKMKRILGKTTIKADVLGMVD